MQKEILPPQENLALDQRHLVLCAHDKATFQANDGLRKGWILDGEQPLKKKGVGCRIHRSDVICSMFGHLKDASQSLVYGVNYKGYWNGALFVRQLKEKIISVFEQAHGPRYQALFFINNSQGHSAYSEDVLLPTHMNLHPGGKQACMCSGWYYAPDGRTKISQPMCFPPEHPTYRNQPKGMKECRLSKACGGAGS